MALRVPGLLDPDHETCPGAARRGTRGGAGHRRGLGLDHPDVEGPDGTVWSRGTKASVFVWAGGIALRVGSVRARPALGVHQGSAALLLALAATLLVRGGIMAWRARHARERAGAGVRCRHARSPRGRSVCDGERWTSWPSREASAQGAHSGPGVLLARAVARVAARPSLWTPSPTATSPAGSRGGCCGVLPAGLVGWAFFRTTCAHRLRPSLALLVLLRHRGRGAGRGLPGTRPGGVVRLRRHRPGAAAARGGVPATRWPWRSTPPSTATAG